MSPYINLDSHGGAPRRTGGEMVRGGGQGRRRDSSLHLLWVAVVLAFEDILRLVMSSSCLEVLGRHCLAAVGRL